MNLYVSMRSLAAAGVAAAVLVGCGQETPNDEAPAASAAPVALELAGGNRDAETAVATISDEYMRGIIKEISDDRYEGRGPGSAGDKLARDYLIERLEEAGLEPGAADGGWEQPFDLVGINASQPDSWTFSGDGQEMTLAQWDDFIAGSGVQLSLIHI